MWLVGWLKRSRASKVDTPEFLSDRTLEFTVMCYAPECSRSFRRPRWKRRLRHPSKEFLVRISDHITMVAVCAGRLNCCFVS